MKQYLELIQEVIDTGTIKEDRTGTGTISKFFSHKIYDLSEGFPLVTTKKVHTRSIIHELLWFISGDTNIKYLVDNDVKIWNEWPYEIYKNSEDYKGESLDEFVEKIKNDIGFATKHGELGPVYGKQWRDFGGYDQLTNIIEKIKTDPNSRRLILSAWNPPEIPDMALPPCHMLFQFYVSNGELSLQLIQRSGDVFLGVPFNIASYSLLLMMVAQVTGLKPGKFIHVIGDTHIYSNHMEQVKKQLKREPKKLPTMKLNPDITNIYDFKYEDFELVDYESHGILRGKVAV